MNSNKTIIAVIDDEESICKGLERLLRSAGFTARSFRSGVDFFRSLEGDRPACLVLDICMMPMSGLAVLDRLAQLNIKLPVIVITGDDREETYEQAIDKGISAFLRKPVDGQVLLDAIGLALGHGG
jgi:FixJ family two-component response regulator